MFDMENFPVPSGIYLCEPLLLTQAIQLTNPFFPNSSSLELEEDVTGVDAENLVKAYRAKDNTFFINRPIVMDYACELIRVVRLIQERKYEIVLCPLRGARLPGIQARVMSDNTQTFRPFNGSGMAQGGNDSRIAQALTEILKEQNTPNQPRQIGVLDTSIGGDSCAALAGLLGMLNKQFDQEWHLRFHLIHNYQKKPSRASQAYSNRSKTLGVEIEYHAVVDLLVEDEPALLGYDADKVGSETAMNRFRQDGQIIYYDTGKATLFRKSQLDEMMIELVSKEISHQIQCLPDAALIDPIRWKYHM